MSKENGRFQVPKQFLAELLPYIDLIYPMHGHIPRYYITGMPQQYDKEEISKGVLGTVHQRLGLSVDLGYATLPSVFYNSLFLLLKDHPDLFSIIRKELPLVLSEQIVPSLDRPFSSDQIEKIELFWPIPHDEESKRTFQFLGFGREEEFQNGIRHAIEEKLARFGASSEQIQRYQKTLAKVEDVYTRSGKEKRNSGESYICHNLRVIWYRLTKLEYFQKISPSEEIIDTLEVLLEHDIKEDIPNSSLLPDCLLVQYSDGVVEFPLKKTQLQRLQALTSLDDTLHLQDVISKDPSGRASEDKLDDRLDNVLTLWHKYTYADLFEKLYETYTSTAALAWNALMSRGSLGQRLKEYTKLATNQNIESTLAVNLLTLGLFEAGMEQFKQILSDRLLGGYGINLKNDRCAAWRDNRVRKYAGVPDEEFPSRFSLQSIVAEYQEKKRLENKNSPFGFTDILSITTEVKRILADQAPVDPFYPLNLYALHQRFDPLEVLISLFQYHVLHIPCVPPNIGQVVLYERPEGEFARIGAMNSV